MHFKNNRNVYLINSHIISACKTLTKNATEHSFDFSPLNDALYR